MSGNQQLNKPKALVLFGFMIVAGILRALPLPPNFAPIGAIALFGGAYFMDKRLAYLLPLVAMMFSDTLLEVLFRAGVRPYSGFHEQMIGVYVGFLGIVFIGTQLQKRLNIFTVTGASLAASTVFFLVSNFNVWALSSVEYPHTLGGLVECYTMAIPFFGNTVMGDLFFTTLLFGTFELLKYRLPKLAFIKS